MKNKKGAVGGGGFMALVALMLIGLVGLGGVLYFVQNTGVGGVTGSSSATQQIVQTSSAIKSGDASTLRLDALDYESTTHARVAAGGFVWNVKTNQLIADNRTLSATDYTGISTAVDDSLRICAFDGSYYADLEQCGLSSSHVSKEIKSSTEYYNAKTHAIANNLLLTALNNRGQVLAGPGGGDLNITLAANEVSDIVGVEVKNNMSSSMFRLKAFAVNASAGSNLDKVTIKGSGAALVEAGDASCKIPQRRRTDIDWQYCLPTAIELHEFDKYTTSSMIFDAGGTNPGELGSFIVLDEQWFKSVKGDTTNQILVGLETDAVSPTDVGQPDRVISMNVI